MLHYAVELALWTLAMFFAGCVIGSLAHSVLKREDVE